ncbi:ArnT family glycosyltransferase [Williamsia maris]|uniref:Dolichyl-phosphate-mannose-protein mannosyltransferase n=1 Tax=Williamsia maris TaxID=72806 RepID=A0ABT1H8S1_9NOCA|nr:glycosyltransferase family 39 protein [Williamsia maris]MCP2174652.1 Dolichyl-phosphate-mannose-protein mannosyltransferase [Williamsia maris]
MTIDAIRPSAPPAQTAPPSDLPPARPIDRIAVAVLLIGTGVFYLWNITVNGSGNVFYAGAAWAGSRNWEALLFGSVDPSNFITVDKPPVSQWVMGLSGQIFGYSSASMLIPEALMGVATVALMYAAGTRVAGRGAGLIAGAALALTPVAAMMFRFNNPDAAMVLLMTAAAYCAIRATATASGRWLALAGVAVGFAFLAKMLEGLMVLPALGLIYLVAAPTGIGRRIVHLVIATAAMAVSAGWYVLLTLWWPASSRPYLAGSTDNNFMNLVLGYNGLARIEGKQQGGGAARNVISSPQAQEFIDRIRQSGGGGGGGGGGRGGAGGMFADGPGITRLFSGEFGIEISWLLPAALVALVVALVLRGRAPRTDLMRAGVLIFGLWMVIDGLVLSYMKSNPHPYYSLAIAPPIAGVVGLGVVECWKQRDRIVAIVGLAAVVAAAGVWGFVLMQRQSSWLPAVAWATLVVTVIATVAVLVVGFMGRSRSSAHAGSVSGRSSRRRFVLGGVAVAAVVGALLAPAAYATEVVATPHTGGGPSVSPASEDRPSKGGGGFGAFFGGTSDKSPELKALLGSTTSRWAAAVSRSSAAAQIELDTEKPVMAIGGFNNDPVPTLAEFQQYIRNGDVTYYLASAGGSRGGGGSGGRRSAVSVVPGLDPAMSEQATKLFSQYNSTSVTGQIQAWVEAHYTAKTVGSYQVYDLRHPTK